MSISELPEQPLNFTVVMTVYQNPSLAVRAISTVARQIYTNWELLIYADGPHPGLEVVIEEYSMHMGMFGRMKYVEQTCPRGTFGNPLRRRGLQEAKGDYVVFMGHDCLLDKDYLLWHAKTISKDPRAHVLSCLRVDHWVKHKIESPAVKVDMERHIAILPQPNFDPKTLQVGMVDLTCLAFPTVPARNAGVFREEWDTEYAADFLGITACLQQLPLVYSPVVAAAHF